MEGDPYHVTFMYLNISEGEGYDEVSAAVNELSLSEINMETELLPVSYGTWASTLQTMLASNEQLDLFMDTINNAPTSIVSGYIADWNEYMDYIPDVSSYYGDEMQAGMVGDFMATIGTVKERPNNSGIICRTDIMEEVGYSLEDFADVDPDNPASYDVFDEMFAAVKAAYPDMTAIAGQQALPSLCTFDSLSDSFGVLEDRGQTTTVTNYYESQQFKDLVTISKRWYDAGYYSADAVTNQDTGETLLKAGNLFSFFVGIKPNTAQEKLAQTGYEVTVIPVAGQTVYSSYGYNAFGFYLANASEDKAKAAAYYNWAFQSGDFHDLINWGIEGVDWVEDENGQAAFPEGMDGQNFGQNQFFYDAAEGLLTATILLVAEFCPPPERHIVSVFKIIQELMAPSQTKGQTQFQVLLSLLPETHKAKWFAGAATSTADQAMASVMSTTLARLNAFLDSEMEQLLCFDTAVDAETFCKMRRLSARRSLHCSW